MYHADFGMCGVPRELTADYQEAILLAVSIRIAPIRVGRTTE